MKAQTYMYGGKVWTHEEVMDLKDRRLRYKILNHDKVKQRDNKYYRTNHEKRLQYNIDNGHFKRGAKSLLSIEV